MHKVYRRGHHAEHKEKATHDYGDATFSFASSRTGASAWSIFSYMLTALDHSRIPNSQKREDSRAGRGDASIMVCCQRTSACVRTRSMEARPTPILVRFITQVNLTSTENWPFPTTIIISPALPFFLVDSCLFRCSDDHQPSLDHSSISTTPTPVAVHRGVQKSASLPFDSISPQLIRRTASPRNLTIRQMCYGLRYPTAFDGTFNNLL